MLCGLNDHAAHFGAEGISEGDVPHNSVTEEGRRTIALGAVENLIRYHHVTGGDVFLHDPARAYRQYMRHTQLLECMNVGAVGDFTRCQAVAFAVARQKVHRTPSDRRLDDRIRWRAEWGGDFMLAQGSDASHLINAGATNDS